MKSHFILFIILLSSGLFAQVGSPPDQTKYILFNRVPGYTMHQSRPETINRAAFEEITECFKQRSESKIKTGISFIFAPFQTQPEQTVASLKNFLRIAEELAVPVLIHFDFEYWRDARPDLWNWWDPSKPGYHPDNRENVEWTHWSSDYAVKLSWRNWGRQERTLPPVNKASPRYLDACREQLQLLVPIITAWYQALPADRQHIFVGVKVGHESSLGVNGYYYPNGNELLDKPESEDPVTGIVTQDVLSRGLQQIGYATIKTAGIRTGGDITEWDLYEAARRYIEFLSREVAQYGIPREKLFTHGAGWRDGELLYDAALNEYACPGWSFYAHSTDPMQEPAVKRGLAQSDAPYWGAVEWLLMEGMSADSQAQYTAASEREAIWKSALQNSLADRRARLVCIFNWEGIMNNQAAKNAIQQLIDEKEIK